MLSVLGGPTLAVLLAAAGSPAEDEPLRAALQVDASALGEDGAPLGKRLQRRGEAVLREAEVLGARTDDDPVVSVSVEALPGDAGYRCAFALQRSGEEIAGTQASTECRLCTDVELEEQVTAMIERLVPKLPRPGEPSSTGQVPPPSAASVDVDAHPSGWVIGRMGQAGIGVSVVGAAALGVGLGLAVGGADSQAVRGSGIGVAAVGGAVLVTGVVLLAVDRSRSGRVTPTAAGIRVSF
jgi:hypothetical protein